MLDNLISVFTKTKPGTRKPCESNISLPIDIDEVGALIRYASENGIRPKAKFPDDASPEVDVVSELYKAYLNYERTINASGGEVTSEAEKDLDEIKVMIVQLYSELSRHTLITEADVKCGFQVNGRTLIETRCAHKHLKILSGITFFLIVFTISDEILLSWYDEVVLPDDGWLLSLSFFTEHVLTAVMPFVWGALGACIYIMMSLYDIAKYRAFDQTKLHGWPLRIGLGAILGAATVSLFDPSAFTEDSVPLQTKSIAFLVGLGVKVVYGGFMALVNTLVEKFNLDSLKTGNAKQTKLKLIEQVSALLSDDDIKSNPQKKEALLEILKKIQSK